MPTYHYKCKGKCRRDWEILASVDAERPTKCEKCGGKVVRIIHTAPIIFRGSGFYATDYKGKPDPAHARNAVDWYQKEMAACQGRGKPDGTGNKNPG